MKFMALVVCLSAGLFGFFSRDHADAACRPVNGHFKASAVPPPECQAPVCTAGRVWGGLAGTYSFVMTGRQPADPGIPAIFFFSGRSTVLVQDDRLLGVDTGSIDLGSGGFASLITFNGGTGQYSHATGQIKLRGTFDSAAGTTAGDYLGEICVPR